MAQLAINCLEAACRERQQLAGSSEGGVQVGRRKPVIQGVPVRKILSGSPGTGYGRELSRQRTKLIEIQHATRARVDLKLTLITEPNMQPTIRTTAPASPSSQPTFKFVRMPTVLQITGLGRSTIYRLIAEKKFPVPVRVGDRAVAWRQVDLDAWSERRMPSSN